MKKLFSFLIAVILFAACQKEIAPFSGDDNGGGTDTTGNNSGIRGAYDFISLSLNAQSTNEVNLFGIDYKTVTPSVYTTTNNSGSFVIDDSLMTASNLSYRISYTTKSYTYENDVLTDSLQFPFDTTFTVANSSAKYTLIGADSIYFPEGSFVVTSAGTAQAEPSGGRYSFNDNLLTITQYFLRDTTIDNSGDVYRFTESGKVSFVMQKR